MAEHESIESFVSLKKMHCYMITKYQEPFSLSIVVLGSLHHGFLDCSLESQQPFLAELLVATAGRRCAGGVGNHGARRGGGDGVGQLELDDQDLDADQDDHPPPVDAPEHVEPR